MATAHRANRRFEHGRTEKLFQSAATESDRSVEEAFAIGDRACFGPESLEKTITVARIGGMEEEDGRDGGSTAARTAQIPHEFAAKNSPEMAEEDPEITRTAQLITQRRTCEIAAVSGVIEDIFRERLHRLLSSANRPGPQCLGNFSVGPGGTGTSEALSGGAPSDGGNPSENGSEMRGGVGLNKRRSTRKTGVSTVATRRNFHAAPP